MKPYLIILAACLLCVTSSCRKTNLPVDLPACIKADIQNNENNPNWSVGEVTEYRYQGKIVYAFEPDYRIIADGSTDIRSDDCKPLCSVGGFGGPSVNLCNGDPFYENAELIRIVWTKP
ncbi:hypothetical protein EXU57_11920 [Segetibacter sp. 3557_3]|uniref:DUF6970 domain-containing protein n=1 Tax=Segetibacter sp. 3557_3 TaxID=2547429 RepID=UPI0010587021|nr:hypothetical protein [Segetibacter sp. 3557_3]TDH26190.1 hypothetical protein EXU57_11920 [Segetibacter sp. 3557_3]